MKRPLINQLLALSVSMAVVSGYGQAVTFSAPVIIDGADLNGTVHNQPADWPSGAGTWNAKGARYNPATQKLVFETYRADIVGGSTTSGAITASVEVPPSPGVLMKVTNYFTAGPSTGSVSPSGTSVLYIANRDGSNASCLGCVDLQDGVNGVKIYKALPSTSATPNSPVEQAGAFVYANQNKDLASWYPGGQWIFASVEMPVHGITHNIGNGEIGMFNDLWAISTDGKTWVQLTDFASTWGTHQDATAHMPYQCYDAANCAVGCQYAFAGHAAGYESYACTDVGVAPPSSGLMRATAGNQLDGANGGVPLVWGERTGIDFRYAFAGSQQLATAEAVLAGGIPALVTYQRNLTPIPSAPSGVGQWSNPGHTTDIGTGYEPFSFSPDDKTIGFASDAFATTSAPTSTPISRASLYFTDSVAWRWSDASPTLTDLTKYDATIYGYQPNAANGLGHWEEPTVYGIGSDISTLVAFASSANLTPPWDPTNATTSGNTFGLDLWVMPSDRSAPAVKVTSFNTPSLKFLAYPTTTDPADNGFFMSVVPSAARAGTNPPGSVYKISEAFDTTGATTPSDLSIARAFPNPWRSDLHSRIDITFDQLTSGSTIKIFDLSGHWVRTLLPSGTSITWDRRNDRGDAVASGLYIYLITDSLGHKTRGKLTIIK